MPKCQAPNEKGPDAGERRVHDQIVVSKIDVGNNTAQHHQAQDQRVRRVHIGRPRYTDRGALYGVTFDGEVIVAAPTMPALDAARVLKARGYTGAIELWDADRPYPRMTADIDTAAGITVEEGSKAGLRFRTWKAFPVGTGRQFSAPRLPQVGLPTPTLPAAGEARAA